MKITFDRLKPHLIAVVIMAAICIAYFSPQLSGKVISADDSNAFIGASHENMEYEKKENRTILWTNSMFGGMPMYQIHPANDGNFISHLNKPLRLFFGGSIGIFIAAFLCFYIMVVSLGGNYQLGIIGAIAFGLTTNNIILWEAGHATKLVTLSYLSLILAGLILVFRKKYILGSILFTIGLALDLGANHIQMTYYFAICLVVFWVMKCIEKIKENNISDLLKINGVLAVCTVLAILTTSTNYLSTFEYQKDTMRGDPILTSKKDEAKPMSSSETDGLAWEYAMQWSNGPEDVFAAIIPGIVGGGSGEVIKEDGALRNLGMQKGQRAPLYWGSLPFTSGPIYFGAILVFLFVLGLMVLKGPLKWWLAFAILLTTFLSMGKHFPSINEFFFYNFPLFNKFRAPNSILGVTSFFVATMGVFTLKEIFQGSIEKAKVLNHLKIAAGITAGFCLLVAFMSDGLFSIGNEGDLSLAEQYGEQFINALNEDRASLMRSDAFRSFLFIVAAVVTIWLFLIGKLKSQAALIIVGSLILVDLWGIDRRYINKESFKPKSNQKSLFTARPVDQQILQDPDISYRVLDLSVNTFNSAQTSYFHQTIGGYSAAKLQRYQDIIDYHISKNNSEVFDMLNTKYIISQDQQLQKNPRALGNAWFVEDIKKVSTPNEEIEALYDFKADSTAIVLDKEFNNYVGDFNPSKNGTIQLTKYVPDRLEYKSNSTSDQFAVFSEIWYGPDKGWIAYIDGKEVPFVRANYVLRGLKVPAGEHKIEFKFIPKSYTIGKTAATISSIIILLLIGFGIFKLVNGKEEELVDESVIDN